ncbi:FBP domain-containing protein [Nocardioides sp.]|uniref:FBP domain-containing protein n=1 Tax=Nocardioides sp. TaxID=35761 RepID=UPI00260A8615|nr:FBP domain-containing protein [Nocardioides sp.]
MSPLTERDLRTSMLNVSKGEAGRMYLPRDLADQPWEHLDYLGWRDPQAPAKGYLVTVVDDRLRGLALRAPSTPPGPRRSMCSICLSQHSGGVSLLVAPRAGKAGRQGNTLGTYLCSDLRCSLYVRGLLKTEISTVRETLSTEQRVERLVRNLADFVNRVSASA